LRQEEWWLEAAD